MNLLGVSFEEIREGYARVSLQLKEIHLNGVGIVQGGVLYSLGDFACAAAFNHSKDAVVTLESSISYIKSTRSGILYAEAEEISRSKSFSSCQCKITDENGRLLATVVARGYIIPER